MTIYFVLGCIFWGTLFFLIFALRSNSGIHSVTTTEAGTRKIITFSVLAALILACTLPMGLAPKWNGEFPEHRNQYEIMAESILNGHLYMDYEVDPKLAAMENPYDRDMRDELGVSYHWDHSFYNGRYYMYFGVVPVFLIFLPYRLLTGQSLTTYHATQIFVALFIIGMFALLHLLSRKFFPKLSLGAYLALSSAFAAISIWYSVSAPALYTTAGTSGLCLQVWSLFFFVKAVYDTENTKKTIRLAFFGSLFGALAVGCRPPIGLANLMVLPLLIKFLRDRKASAQLIRQLIFAASPYFVVGILLMLYNYARFENPFEFGQAYQLTVVDQSNYGSYFTKANIFKAINGIGTNFLSFTPIKDTFPYLSFGGALVNFPIFLVSLWGLAQAGVRKKLKDSELVGFVGTLLFLLLFITVMDSIWAPTIYERSRMDIYWLMGVLCFLNIGFIHENLSEPARKKWCSLMSYAALATIFCCFLFWAVPVDDNLTSWYPWVLGNIKRVFIFGIGK